MMDAMVDKRREKFVELAEKRVTRVLKDLRLVGNLANKGNYSYTEEDVKRIYQAVEGEMKNLKRRFEDSSDDSEMTFKLR